MDQHGAMRQLIDIVFVGAKDAQEFEEKWRNVNKEISNKLQNTFHMNTDPTTAM